MLLLHLEQEVEDAEVAAERERVVSGRGLDDVVCLHRLHKRYGPPGCKVHSSFVLPR